MDGVLSDIELISPQIDWPPANSRQQVTPASTGDEQKPACLYARGATDMHVSTCRKQIRMNESGPSFHDSFPRHFFGDASGRAQNPLESGS